MASLVKSLVYDFCLNKSARDPALSTCSRRRTGPLSARERTMDEKRAVLACFYLTSQYVLVLLFVCLMAVCC